MTSSSSLVSYDNSSNGDFQQSLGLLTVPYEMVHAIFLHLHYETLQTFSLVSKECSVMVASFWRVGFKQRFPTLQPENGNDQRNFIVHSNIDNQMNRVSFLQVPQEVVLQGDQWIMPQWMTAAFVCQNYLVTRDAGSVVQIWDLKSLTPIGILDVQPTKCLGVYQGKTVFATLDLAIELWDLTENQCTDRLEYGSLATCVASDQQYLILGYQDGTVIVWDVETSFVPISFNLQAPITALKVHQGKIVVGDATGQISIFDLTTQQRLCNVTAHKGQVKSMVIHQGALYSCSTDGSIKIWDLETLKSKGSITENKNPTDVEFGWYLNMELMDGRLFVNASNPLNGHTAIIMWDLVTKKGTILKRITNLTFVTPTMHNGKLIMGWGQGGLQICDFTVPERRM